MRTLFPSLLHRTQVLGVLGERTCYHAALTSAWQSTTEAEGIMIGQLLYIPLCEAIS